MRVLRVESVKIVLGSKVEVWVYVVNNCWAFRLVLRRMSSEEDVTRATTWHGKYL